MICRGHGQIQGVEEACGAGNGKRPPEAILETHPCLIEVLAMEAHRALSFFA